MSKPCPLPRAQIGNGARDARPEWLAGLEYLERPVTDPIVPLVKAGQDRWTREAEVFRQALARLARREREKVGLTGEEFEPLVWKEEAKTRVDSKGAVRPAWFDKGSASDVHRFEKQDGFTPLNLVETCRLLNEWEQGRHLGDDLMAGCVRLVRYLYRGSRRPERASPSVFRVAEVVNAAAAGLRAGGAIAATRWDDCWGHWPVERQRMDDVEKEIEKAVRGSFIKHLRNLKTSGLYWVARNDRSLPKKEGLLLVMEGLGGRRNFSYGLNLYSTAVAVVWATAGRRGRWRFEPICAGVYAPAEGQLYLGVAGDCGGAIVIDERERHHPARALQGSTMAPGAELAVGLHHSRSHKRRGRDFVDRVSRLLPAYVNRAVALGAGNYCICLTAAGHLGGYFESSVNLISAYAGTIILAAATGRPESATDLAGHPWGARNSLTKRGRWLLAWGHEGLRADIGDALATAPKKSTATPAKQRKKRAVP